MLHVITSPPRPRIAGHPLSRLAGATRSDAEDDCLCASLVPLALAAIRQPPLAIHGPSIGPGIHARRDKTRNKETGAKRPTTWVQGASSLVGAGRRPARGRGTESPNDRRATRGVGTTQDNTELSRLTRIPIGPNARKAPYDPLLRGYSGTALRGDGTMDDSTRSLPRRNPSPENGGRFRARNGTAPDMCGLSRPDIRLIIEYSRPSAATGSCVFAPRLAGSLYVVVTLTGRRGCKRTASGATSMGAYIRLPSRDTPDCGSTTRSPRLSTAGTRNDRVPALIARGIHLP